MSDDATELLFSYGTLQLEAVQVATFGRTLEGVPDALPGHRLDKIPMRDSKVVRVSGTEFHLIARPAPEATAPVPGVVFRVSLDELARADGYETDDYQRVRVTLASGTQCWVYTAPAGPPWRIEFIEQPRVVLVDGAGWLTMSDLLARARQTLDFAREQDCTRFVFDDRTMVPRLSTAEIYRLPTEFERLGWIRTMRVANVYDPRRADAAEEYRMFSGLAVTRGFAYCLFTELDAAVAWAAA